MMPKLVREYARLAANRVCTLLVAAALVFSCAGPYRGVSVQADEALTVSASFQDKQVAADEPIEFRLNRPLGKEEGTLAIIIGQSDLTGLFTVMERGLRYDAKALPLPSGESEVTVYLVSPDNEWREVARFTLRVGNEAGQGLNSAQEQAAQQAPPQEDAAQTAKQPRKLGFEKLDFIPSVSLSLNSQPAQSNFPATSRPDRATFTDLNLQMSFRSEMERGPFSSQTQFDFVGTSFRQSALRFGQLGERAPLVDLSSYLMQFKVGRVRYQAGHFTFGTSRHLMNGFSSRGLMVSVPLSRRADLAVSAMNGTSIIGYSNFFGIDKRRHRLVSGAIGFEFLPERPGGLRAEVSMLDAWLQPVNGLSQASVNDAERSRGLAARVIATDRAQRFRLDAGFSRSRFISPPDPLLEQGRDVVQLPSVARNARYLDASYDILRDLALTKEKRVNLSFAFRYERVDPLYRSLGASTQADKASNDYSVTGSVGEISAQYTHSRFGDNLRNIPSILRSLTRADTLSIGAPLASLFAASGQPSPLLPRVSYSLNRVGQFGEAIPVRGGFELDPSSIPDQLSTGQSITADWQIDKWRLGYRLNHSFQNNRQPQREAADFANLVNGFTVGVSPSDSLDLNVDISAESADNKEAATVDRTFRLAPAVNWRMTRGATFASNLSITLAGDEARTRQNRNVEFDLQWAYRFGVERDRFRKVQGQFFIRYANRYARIRNDAFGPVDLQKTQIVNLGLSINLF